MPPTMILIGVCACAGAASRGDAAIAAKTAAARILRMGSFRRIFWALLGVFAGRQVPSGRVFAAFSEAMRPPAPRGVNRGYRGARWRARAKLLSSLRFTTRSIAMDVVTPKGSETAETHSHVVHPDSMEWQKTRFPGCEAKTLLFDRTTGLMTALMRFQPGTGQPDHEHVNIEQTYVLEGSLVDKEGPAKGIECK